MHLTPTERDRLLLFSAAELARARRDGGVLLNVPEATALVADAVCEAARRGARHDDALRAGRSAVARQDLLPDVPHVVRTVSVEAVFTDGSRLVVVDEPFGPVDHDPRAPGSITVDERSSETARDIVKIPVHNTASVPVTVTSHFHFFEVNPRLRFARASAYGRHLDVPAGGHLRFDPDETREVELVPIRGARVVIGFAGLVDGPLDAPGAKEQALNRARACGFLDSDEAREMDPADAAHAVLELRRLQRPEDAS